jgi:peptide/nickel transport system substrate-binding protein
MNKRHKKINLLFIILITGFLSINCSKTARDPDILVIGSGGSLFLGNNNPVLIQRNSNAWETFSNLSDSLEPKPMLADSWRSTDSSRIWILTLRKNVPFQNGDTLNAQLAIDNILRLKHFPEMDLYSVYTFLDTVIERNNYEIELKFKRPLVSFPSKIGHYFIGLFSPKAFDKRGKLINPIGCGPYELTEIKTGEYDRFKAFNNYYLGKPAFKEVEFRIIPDPMMRIMALIRGDIDLIAHKAGISSHHLKYLLNYPNIKIDSFKAGITHYLLFNSKSSFFINKVNRIHLNEIIDRDKIVNLILNNKGYAAEDFFIETKSLWSKKRFSKNGIISNTNHFNNTHGNEKLILLLNQSEAINWEYKAIAEYLCDLLKKEGIEMEINSLEGEVYKKYLQSGKYDITLYPLSIPTGTPELFLRALVYSKGMQSTRSYSLTHYKSTVIDSLFEKCIIAPDLLRQEFLYDKILNLLGEEKIILPLFHEKYYIAYNKRIKNVKIDPFLKPDLFSIQKAF